MRTTVLATESDSPNTMRCSQSHQTRGRRRLPGRRDKALQHRALGSPRGERPAIHRCGTAGRRKHQEDDSNLQTAQRGDIRGIAGRVGSDDDTGKEIANDGERPRRCVNIRR
jgi:hypothetical protein